MLRRNLGLEPIYILDVLVDVCTDHGTERSVITDRSELSEEEVTNPTEATNQGPLTSGRFFNIGTFEELITRASGGNELPPPESLRWVQVTVIAATSAESSIAGACRKYAVQSEDGRVTLYPTTIIAEQIRSRNGKRKAIKQLSTRLVDAD